MTHSAHPDHLLTGKTAQALLTSSARNRKIRWEFDGSTHEFSPKYGWAALDPTTDLIIVVVGSADLPYPNNAIVLNPDSSMNHQIISPTFVKMSAEGSPTELHQIECMSDVYIDENHRLVIGLDFRYEWVERRQYEPQNKKWGERVLIYRR